MLHPSKSSSPSGLNSTPSGKVSSSSAQYLARARNTPGRALDRRTGGYRGVGHRSSALYRQLLSQRVWGMSLLAIREGDQQIGPPHGRPAPSGEGWFPNLFGLMVPHGRLRDTTRRPYKASARSVFQPTLRLSAHGWLVLLQGPGEMGWRGPGRLRRVSFAATRAARCTSASLKSRPRS